jgi:hypothetical protein
MLQVPILGPTVLSRRYGREASNVIQAMAIKPSTIRGGLIDTLARSLFSTGVFALSDLLYVLCAHDAGAAWLNWIDPLLNPAIPTNSPTFLADNGYQGDAVSASIATGRRMNALAQYKQNSASVTVAVTGPAVASDRWCGPDSGTTTLFMGLGAGLDYGARLNSTAGGTAAGVNGKGVYTINRNNSANFQMYKDGVQVFSATVASTAPTTASLLLLASNGVFGTGPQAYGRFGAALTPAQIAAEAAAVKAFINGCNPGLLP